MVIFQGHPDVQLLLASLFHVYQDKDDRRGRWVAYLTNPLGCDQLPPGQDWPTISDDILTCVPVPAELRAETDWAAVPYFQSHDSAIKEVMWWANRCQKLVKACQKEALEGLSYRAAQARKLEGQHDQTT